MALVTGKKSRSRSLIDDGRKTQSRKLFLRGLELNEIPEDLFSYPFEKCLEMLDLSNNKLFMINQKVGIFVNLRDLILSGNQLRVIPADIGHLRKLVTLDLSRNRLETLPRTINNIKELEVVNLSGNNLKIMPDFLLCLPKLHKVFCIRNGNLENIPKDIAADGLDAMRKYLNITVEVYENDLEFISMKERRQGCIFSEIEQKWILENEQLTKKTKDVSTQLEEKDKYSRMQGLHQNEISISTQTEFDDNYSSTLSLAVQRPFSRRYDCQSDVEVMQRDKGLNEDQAMKELARIFRKQIQLVSEYRKNPQETAKRKISCDSVFGHSFSKVSRTRPMCNSCGLQRREMFTSEYGSMSSCSQLYDESNVIADEENDDSCYGNEGSHHDDISEYDINCCLLDSTSDFSMDDSYDEIWCPEEYRFINACEELVIRKFGVEVKVPHMTLSGHCQDEFKFQTIDSIEYSPILGGNMVLASPVIHVAPHGARFYSHMEAVLKLPLNVVVEEKTTVYCYESDTDLNEPPLWKEIPTNRFECSFGNVTIKATHFSLFCAAAGKACPTIQKRVSASNGGTLALEEVKDCSIYFPKKSLKSDEDISMTVLFDDKKYNTENRNQTKASPIVALEPSGIHFEEEVTITLPLPDASKVYEVNIDPKLLILESQTEASESPEWKELKTTLSINNTNGTYSVSFTVKHFTIFQAVWDGLLSALEAVRKRAEVFVPQFTYRVYFQALMSDCHHSKQFGLCILCHLAGNPPVTDCSQFPVEVGRSKPRDLSKGTILIELKSKKFKADLDVGEVDGMAKDEKFSGLEFDKQFALTFIEPVKEGNFGKVFIVQKEDSGNGKPVVDFLLQKTHSKRMQTKRKPTALETKLTQEVAGLLTIEERWKELAITLGYTRNEANTKFTAENPIEQILTDFMSRGGDDNDFIKAMFEVARRLKLIPFDQMMENRENRRMENCINSPTSSDYCSCPDSPEKTPLKSVKRKMMDRDFEEGDLLSDARLDRIAGWIAEKWKHVGRALGIEQTKISEIELNHRYEGGREKAFQMLAVWKELYPERCSASFLKRALKECGLNNTARRLFPF